MTLKIILTGDVNLMNVNDPTVPFRKVAAEFKAADLVFSNMECCLYTPPHGESVDGELKSEGLLADPGPGGEALKLGGIQAVGIANNVNYGADAITASIARLDELKLAHTGAGANATAACAPIILERQGKRIGILQRTAVYWATNHEASANTVGVAALKCHTAYQLPFHKLRPDLAKLGDHVTQASVAALAAFATASIGSFNLRDNWIGYVVAQQKLIHERLAFENKADAINNSGDVEDLLSSIINRRQEILKSHVKEWRQMLHKGDPTRPSKDGTVA